MQKIKDKNYFLEKLSKDREINDLLSSQSKKENLSFFENLQEIRRILHLKDQTDRAILKEYDRLIVLPTGSEETLIRELHQFNKEMYNNFPEHYIFDFGNETSKKIHLKQNENYNTQKNILKLAEPYVQKINQEQNTIDPINENIFLISEDLSLNKSNTFLNKQDEIIVNSENEKNEMISNLKDILNLGDYKKLNLKGPVAMSCTRYMQKLKNIKNGFEKTYGSYLFVKIKNWIQEENAIYKNIDHIKNIDKLKKQKFKFLKTKFKKLI